MALPNDCTRIVGALANIEGSSNNYTGTKPAAARALIRKTYLLAIKAAADGAAATTTAGAAVASLRMAKPGRILGATFVPDASLTANDTNYGTLQIEKRDGLGGAPTVIASVNTTITVAPFSGNMAQLVSVPLTVNATLATREFAAGAVLTYSITKTGTGIVVPQGSFFVDVEEEGPDTYAV